ncbi:MAG: glycosyltransferase [Ignavibacteriaceae bacterium]
MKKTNILFTCIISVYNEKERVGNVLDQMVQVKNLSQIICVDSASTDGSADFVKQNQLNSSWKSPLINI